MPGRNYATWSAALISPKGFVLGAIDPAIILIWAQPQKETQRKAGQSTLILTSGVDAAMYVVQKI